ncbi:DUF2681 domain-containing protein [Phytoactinopolyspora limicola]|nr:DUF2681 domain-containing protein [Phytoactinopolyspora limicola]
MDTETWIWTIVFFGGTVVIVAFLLYWAWKKDRGRASGPEDDAH